MADSSSAPNKDPAFDAQGRPRIRWWPAVAIVVVTVAVVFLLRSRDNVPFQQRNLLTLGTVAGGVLLLLLWWLMLSRAPFRLRLIVLGGFAALVVAGSAAFRIRGVTGDLLPILEPRWAGQTAPLTSSIGTNRLAEPTEKGPDAVQRPDFPQFLGPDRTGVLTGLRLDPDWETRPPEVLWRTMVGAGWSGFAIVGSRALTQEQRGDDECVTCYDTRDGRLLWVHTDPVRYFTTIAGEGPRCTPTVVGDRVYALGATGVLTCLDLAAGAMVWQRDIARDAATAAPEWGYSGSPLVYDGRVVVSAGGRADRSLLSYLADTGAIEWAGGSNSASYGSPFLATLGDVRQVLAFNHRRITAHEADSGRVLWEYPWGSGQPQVANPVIVGANRVLFSSGYGVGSELIEVRRDSVGALAVESVWQSRRMKAKFANLVAREGFLYGLDDGILACVALVDGSLRWKEGRYGHGQGLLVEAWYLLMDEGGRLRLLAPTPEAPNELRQFRVFEHKTWNPMALAGDLLLVRNDREAAAVRLPLLGGIRYQP